MMNGQMAGCYVNDAAIIISKNSVKPYLPGNVFVKDGESRDAGARVGRLAGGYVDEPTLHIGNPHHL